MNRCLFDVRMLGFLVAVVGFSLTVVHADRPNIVFIMADDLGWADVGFHGGNAPTPNLDRLAATSLELTQHYVAPVCSPTRAGLLTGRYWSRFGITTPTNGRGLPESTMTLPRVLGDCGYETCLVGKWHLGSTPQSGPNHYGFDHAYGSLAGGVTPWSHRYKKGAFERTWHRNGALLDETGHVTDLLTEEAIRWIRSRNESPFFLYVPFTAVHLPLSEPEQWLDRVPVAIVGEVPRQYAACLMHLDDSVGRILSTLESVGKRNQTIVVVTSDNGGSTAENNNQPYPPDNCPDGKLPGNNTPFRGQKGDVYEGGTRAVTLVSWPGKIETGRYNSPVAIIDWMPTLCALAGYENQSDLGWDGVDLTAALLRGEMLADRTVYLVGTHWRERSLRSGKWKLIVRDSGKQSIMELYDIESDPLEKANLVNQNSPTLSRMLGLLEVVSKADRDSVVAGELK